MHATSVPNGKAQVGDAFPTLQLAATSGQRVTDPDPAGEVVHLQLRRLARVPDLHPSLSLHRTERIMSGLANGTLFPAPAEHGSSQIDG